MSAPASGPGLPMARGRARWLAAAADTPSATFALVVALALALFAFVYPAVAPDPFDPVNVSMMDAFTPPLWAKDGVASFPLGTDDQGRDMLAALAFGLRASLLIGILSVGLGLVLGVSLGLLAGFAGGWVDALIMRVADVQLAYPALLLAMIIDGAARAALGPSLDPRLSLAIVVVSIGVAFWVQYARTVRSSVLVERSRDYVAAARVTGRSSLAIAVLHILPNVMAPVLVVATINLGIAIITEATLSFLGIGVPLTQASLGMLIRNGNNFLQSGEWWISAWPCLLLVVFVVAVNVLGDHWRDVFNPKLRRRR